MAPNIFNPFLIPVVLILGCLPLGAHVLESEPHWAKETSS